MCSTFGRTRALLVGLTVIALLAGGAVLWHERTSLLAWYYVSRLANAADADVPRWQGDLVALDEAAVPRLLDVSGSEIEQTSQRASAVLTALADSWPEGDTRRNELAGRLAAMFLKCGPVGQRHLLDVLASLGPTTPPVIARVLGFSSNSPDAGLRTHALGLAERLLQASQNTDSHPDVVAACRELVAHVLRDGDQLQPETRLAALRLAQRPELTLLEAVVPLLNDPVPEVRRNALLAVGPLPEVLATDELLHWLHDQDGGIRQLCEMALRGRGLTDHQIRLGRLLTDPRPAFRLKVLDHLDDDGDLDPGVWLRRLSHDPAPAVRAAAVRCAANLPGLDLSDRLQQIAQNDASATVKQLAVHYLQRRASAARR